MSTYDAGDARLKIYPDASQFKRRLEEQLKAIQVEYSIKANADTAPAEKTTEEFRQREKAKPVKTALELDVDKAEGRLREWRIREEARKLGINVTVDTEHAALQLRLLRAEAEARSIKVRLDVDDSQFAGIGDTLSKAFGALTSGGLTSPGSVIGIAGLLPAAASGVGQVAAAIQQLAGVAPVLPGALAGIAAVVGTVKLGLSGVPDAFDAVVKSSDGTAKSIAAAQTALAGLAPSAADAVKTAVELKGELAKALTLPIQQNLFDGLSESARKLYDSDIPILQQRLPQLASSLNDIVKQTLDSLGSDSTKGFLDRILGNTDTATATLKTAIDPIINAIGQVTTAGSNALPRLADDIAGVADKFDKFITEASNSGELDTWIRNGITGFEQLADTAGHIVDAISTIADAAGGDLLKNLDEVSGKFSTWLNSTDGQQQLHDFLDQGKRQLSDIIDIVGNVEPAFKAAFGGAGDAVSLVLKPIKLLTDAFDSLPGWLKDSLAKSAVSSLNPTLLPGQVIDQINTKGGAQQAAEDKLKAAKAAQPGIVGSAPVAPGPALAPAAPPSAVPGQNPLQVIAPGHATGGVLPGFSPGVDNMLVPMSGGEGVIVPTVTRQLGPAGIAAINGGALTRGLTGHIGWGVDAYDANKPTGGGNFNPRMLIDTSATDSGPDNAIDVLSAAMGDRTPRTTADMHQFPGLPGIFAGRYNAAANFPRKAGYATGGIVDPFGNPVTVGPAPGPGGFVPGAGPAPIAANPAGASGGFGDIFGSILSGLGGPISNIAGLASGATGGGQTGSGFTSTGSFMDRLAGIPGIAGLIGSAGSSDPGAALTDWGSQTGKWLGSFTAKTIGGFGNALWQGALGLVGLDNSILSPNNPWFQDAAKSAGFALDNSGPLGALLGVNTPTSKTGAGASKAPTEKQLRTAGEKVQRADQRVAEIQQRISELQPTAKQSQRQSLADQLGNAQQQATDARTDMATLVSGGASGTSGTSTNHGGSAATSFSPGGGAEQWRPLVAQIVAARGVGPGWIDPLLRQIQTESAGNPGSINPNDPNGRGGTQQVEGLFNFLPSTFAGAGGSNIWDPSDQINAAITYVQNKYGQSGGAPNWIGVPGRGFARGGTLPGFSPGVDNMLVPMSGGEGVIVPEVAAKLGPAGIAAINAGKLTRGFADGGIIPTGVLLPTPPTPNFTAAKAAQAQTINPPGGYAQIPNANTKQLPAPVGPPAPPAPPAPPGPPAPSQSSDQPTLDPGFHPKVGAAPTNYNHNLDAVNTGIASGASAIGNAVSMAAGVAGGSGFAPGAGAIGQVAAGAIQEGGKAVTDLVNVGSSFLVGSVPGNLGGDGPAQGAMLTSPQNVPQTAQDNRRTYSIQAGYRPADLIDAIQLHDAQMLQGQLARFRG